MMSLTVRTTLVVASLMTSLKGDGVRVCYFGTWAGWRDEPGRIRPDKFEPFLCTHIICSFVKVDNDTLTVDFYDEELNKLCISETNKMKKVDSSLKSMVAVGGWNHGSKSFLNMLKSDSKISTFTKSVLKMMENNDLDGFDVDWEYPKNAKDKFSKLLRALRKEFDQSGKEYILTAAVNADKKKAKTFYDTAVMAETLDYLFVMSYDLHGYWDNMTGHQSALKGDKDNFDVSSIATYYQNGGMPIDKIVLGFPTYGRTFKLKSKSEHGVGANAYRWKGPKGYFSQQDGHVTYFEMCTQYLTAGGKYVWDNINKASYVYKNDEWISFDSKQAMCHKLAWLHTNGFKGWMIWGLQADDHSNICGEGKFPLTTYLKDNVDKALTEEDCDDDKLKPKPIKNSNIPTLGTQEPVQPTSGTNTAFCQGKVDGLHADTHDCSKYIHCAGGKAYPKSCQQDLMFNAASKTCDYPRNIDKTLCSETDGQAPSETATAFCQGKNDGLYTDTHDCSRYIHCAGGKTYPKSCPQNLMFNAESQVCDYPRNIDKTRCTETGESADPSKGKPAIQHLENSDSSSLRRHCYIKLYFSFAITVVFGEMLYKN